MYVCNNRVDVRGHKYVFGPAQNHFSPSVARLWLWFDVWSLICFYYQSSGNFPKSFNCLQNLRVTPFQLKKSIPMGIQKSMEV